MDFGQNFYNLLLSNIQPLVLGGLLIMGVMIMVRKKIAEMVGFVIVAIIAIGIVFNPTGTKDVMLKVYNGIFNSSESSTDGKKTGSVTDVRYYGANGLILQEMGLLSETEVAFVENDGAESMNGYGV